MNHLLFSLFAGIGATIAIGFLAFAETLHAGAILLMAPFGASAVIIFGLPKSPLAQPKNVILGHVITAFIGLFFVEFIGVTALNLAIATGLGVTVMLLTKTTHPPAGANPILIMMTELSKRLKLS
jgi:CBS-domain-containing membrane protein